MGKRRKKVFYRGSKVKKWGSDKNIENIHIKCCRKEIIYFPLRFLKKTKRKWYNCFSFVAK